MPPAADDTGALEQARSRLYKTGPVEVDMRRPLSVSNNATLQHAWTEEKPLPTAMPEPKKRHVRVASLFFGAAVVFFVVSVAVAGYLFYSGGNTVAAENIDLTAQGPTTVASGDVVPLLITMTNRNPVAVENATVEISFPEGTRNASNTLEAYPRYVENLGSVPSGATITRTVRAALFGGAGQNLTIPMSFSYNTSSSNAVFVKKATYDLGITSTPLEVAVNTLSETVAGKPVTLTLTVRSNAAVALNNVVVAGQFPYGFTVTDSSLPLSNSSFLIGTMAPGAVKTITLTGTLAGQDNEQRAFHFSVGTARTANDQTLAVTYMSQDASVGITAPFINTTLTLNGDSVASAVVNPGSHQNVTVTYANTLPTAVSNVTVTVAIAGAAVDYKSIQSTRGFYRSVDHTVVFSQDKDSSLASLAPGASGIGNFNFSTLAAGAIAGSPTITFTISVSGTRVGQSNVPEAINATVTKTAKVQTAVALTATTLHSTGPIANTGPIPPKADLATTYSVVWGAKNQGSTVAGGQVTATLPSYVTYTGKTSGTGTFSYDSASRLVTWSVGDLAQGANAQGVFQVAVTPSTSQKNSAPQLAGTATFAGFDRFASVQVKATAGPATTETPGDPGYAAVMGTVQ